MNCQCRHDYEEETIDLTPLLQYLETEAVNTTNLITALQKTQEIYGYLPQAAILAVANAYRVKPAKVMGVASFYTQFRLSPSGRYLIQLCQGTACHVNGSDAIGEAITEVLGITDGQTTPDGMFTLMNVACLGCCSLSPVMMVNGEPYGLLTPESVKKVLSDVSRL